MPIVEIAIKLKMQFKQIPEIAVIIKRGTSDEFVYKPGDFLEINAFNRYEVDDAGNILNQWNAVDYESIDYAIQKIKAMQDELTDDVEKWFKGSLTFSLKQEGIRIFINKSRFEMSSCLNSKDSIQAWLNFLDTVKPKLAGSPGTVLAVPMPERYRCTMS